MQENKVFQEFLQNTYDKNKNYKSILSKTKGGINMKKKILNIAAIVIIIIGLGILTPKIYAKIAFNIDYKKYQERQISRENIAIKESTSNGFAENIDMDYVYKDGVGVKVDSLLLTSDHLGINLDIQLNEDVLNENTKDRYTELTLGYAIYDENNNIYCIDEPTIEGDLTYWKKLYKELNLKEDYGIHLNDSSSHGAGEKKGKTVPYTINANSTKGFPESRKLYIRVFQLSYRSYSRTPPSIEFKPITDNEWQFEIDIPEKFYERSDIELKLSKEINGIKLNKATITETSLTMIVEIDGLSDYIPQIRNEEDVFELIEDIAYITDEKDNVYIAIVIGSTGKENEQKLRFGIGKKQLENKLFLHINLNNVHEVIELVQ